MSLSRNSKRIRKRATTTIERSKFCHPRAPMRLIYLDLSISALKKCNANPHHRSTKEEKHCVAQQPPMNESDYSCLPTMSVHLNSGCTGGK
jgi:hypothetical protein